MLLQIVKLHPLHNKFYIYGNHIRVKKDKYMQMYTLLPNKYFIVYSLWCECDHIETKISLVNFNISVLQKKKQVWHIL